MTVVDLFAAISFPILERIPLFGDAAISPHGLGIAIGFGLGAVLMVRRAEKRGLGHVHEPDVSQAVQELLTRAAIGAIVGARGFYVLTHLGDFEGEWHRVLYAWEGGLTFLGGVAGAILFAIPFARRRGWRMTMLLDSAAPGIALGLAIGRIGDLMIGDHIGAPTDFALGWRCTGNYWVRESNGFGFVEPLAYPTTFEPTAGCFDVAVHHTALYDFGATVVVLLVLLWMERRPWFDGAFITAWVWVYGALRFTSDFARQDKQIVLGLTGSQLSLLGASLAIGLVLLRLRPWERPHRSWDLVFDHPWKRPGFDAASFDGAADAPTPGASSSVEESPGEAVAPDPAAAEVPSTVEALAAPMAGPLHPGEGPTPPGDVTAPGQGTVPDEVTAPDDVETPVGPDTSEAPNPSDTSRPPVPSAPAPDDEPAGRDELARPPRPWGEDPPRMASRPRRGGDSGA